MPEATDYIDLDITDVAGQLPPVKMISAVYSYESADAISTSPPTQLIMELRSMSEPFPTGYVVASIVKIEVTKTRYDSRPTSYGVNFNNYSKTRLNQIIQDAIYGADSLPETTKATATNSASSSTKRYVERTITFLLVPAGCIEAEEETEEE